MFGGPGEIRTHDLFHAMEARSQPRHRPRLALVLLGFALLSFSACLARGRRLHTAPQSPVLVALPETSHAAATTSPLRKFILVT
jgi:hypothetical protein